MFNANFHYDSLIPNRAWNNPRLVSRKLPPALRRPMRIKGSLTQFIESQSGSKMHVTVLSEAWERPLKYESKALGLKPRHVAWVRQVLLSVEGKRWVYARSVVPQSSLKGQWRELTHLHQKPLGSLLFKRQKSHRGVICIGHKSLPLSAAQQRNLAIKNQSVVWARYSAFTKHYPQSEQIRVKKILVSEYFLNDFLKP